MGSFFALAQPVKIRKSEKGMMLLDENMDQRLRIPFPKYFMPQRI